MFCFEWIFLLYLSEIVDDIADVWPMTINEYFSKERFQGIMIKKWAINDR